MVEIADGPPAQAQAQADWIRNRNRHLHEGRNNASLEAQQIARDWAREDLIAELQGRDGDSPTPTLSRRPTHGSAPRQPRTDSMGWVVAT